MLVGQRNCIVFSFLVCMCVFFLCECVCVCVLFCTFSLFYITVKCKFTLLLICEFLRQNKNLEIKKKLINVPLQCYIR